MRGHKITRGHVLCMDWMLHGHRCGGDTQPILDIKESAQYMRLLAYAIEDVMDEAFIRAYIAENTEGLFPIGWNKSVLKWYILPLWWGYISVGEK